MDKSRRNFLRKAGLGLVGAGVGMAVPGAGRAIDHAFLPDLSLNPEDLGPKPWDDVVNFCPPGKRVLEIVLYGGVSPWETFWVSEGGTDTFTDHEMQRSVDVNMRGAGDLVRNFDWCDEVEYVDHVKFFAQDDSNQDVYWGPATQPLWDDAIMDSARMITFGHDKNVHELAMP